MKIRVAILGILAASVGVGASPKRQAGSLTTWSTQVVPLVIVGEGWSQRVILTNVDAKNPAIGTLSFYTRDGGPWAVNLKDQGRSSVFLVNLTPGQTAIYETVVDTGSQALGWAILDQNTQGLGDLLGQTVFRKQTAGMADFMCSVLLGARAFTRLSVFFDNTEGKFTGMGILTSELCSFDCNQGVALRVTVRDLSGNVVSQKIISQRKGVLYWMNLGNDFPETNGKTGTFVVEPMQAFGSYLTGFSLQFAPNGAFTAITPFED